MSREDEMPKLVSCEPSVRRSPARQNLVECQQQNCQKGYPGRSQSKNSQYRPHQLVLLGILNWLPLR